jgi:hypothetical protein
MQIVNNKTPTFPKSKNILDLTIMSIELMKYFKNFQVLKKIDISDHYPTLTTLIEAQPCVQPKIFTRINWSKFKDIVDCSTENLVLDNEKSIDEEVEKMTKIIQTAIEMSKVEFTVKTNKPFLINLPYDLVHLIKLKRNLRRLSKIKILSAQNTAQLNSNEK